MGLVAEGLCTRWVQAVAQKRAIRAGFLSSLWAGFILLGIEKSMQQGWAAASWVVGYGAGSYLVVKLGS